MTDALKEIKKITKFMKQSGVLRIKSLDIEIELAPHAFVSAKVDNTPDKEPVVETYTPEEILFFSSPGAIPEEANA